MLKRILIIHPEGNAFNNPTLKALLDHFLERGCEIDIRCDDTAAPKPHVPRLHWLITRPLIRRAKSLLMNRLSWLWACRRLVLWEYGRAPFKYDLVFGVDREGLIQASTIATHLKVPLILFSFEIMFEEETSKRYKEIERICSRNISLYVVQDETRNFHLARENGLTPDKHFLWPLASAGGAEKSPKRLRDHLGIPPEKKVAISVGSLAPWTMAREICFATRNWSDDWCLILHERYGKIPAYLSEGELAPLIGKKIFLSHESVDSVDQMAAIFNGVDLGLAFYKPDYSGPWTGNNLKYIGMASGKIATYLRYGVPVVMNDIGEYAQKCQKYEFGFVIEDPKMLPQDISQENWGRLSENARKFFLENLDNSKFSVGFYKKLTEIRLL